MVNYNKIIDLYKDGYSMLKIQKILGYSYSTISKYINQYKIPKHRNIKLYKYEDVINLYKSGYSITYIGKLFKCGRKSITSILKRNNISIINYHNITKFNENVFDIIDSEEKAYWLGFIFADGNISSPYKNGKPKYTFELSLALKDKEHLDKFNTFMQHEKDNVKCDSYRCRWIATNKHL